MTAMFMAQVTGSIVSTQKVDSMVGQKLLIVEPLRLEAKKRGRLDSTGRTFVVVDTVGAGEGEVVLCVQGSSARFTAQTEKLPIDAAIVGIIDQVHVGDKSVRIPSF
jgi:ethanolamine utilization protein EutN